MTPHPRMRVVSEEPLDITLAMRADIKARDWARVHVAADRREPISLGERVKRVWLR
jgi:hypothetical protein